MSFVKQGTTVLTKTPTIATVTAGHSLLSIYISEDTGTIASPPTDSAGQTWTLIDQTTGSGMRIALAGLLSANSGTHTLTWPTPALDATSSISEWTQFASLAGGTKAVHTATSATTHTSSSYTPASSGELVIAICAQLGTGASDGMRVTTAAFQSIGTASDAGTFKAIHLNQNGGTANGAEGNAVIPGTTSALSATWTWTTAEVSLSMLIGVTDTSSGINLTGQTITSSEGTVSRAVDYSLTGQTATFTEGTISASANGDVTLSLSGQTATFTEGFIALNLGYTLNDGVPLTGQTANFAEGTATGAVSYLLGSQSASFTEGTITATTGGDITLSLTGQTATFSEGTITPTATLGITGQSASFAEGTIASEVDMGLIASSATFTEGTITASGTGDISLSLSGLTATFSEGLITCTGGTQSLGAGRRTRNIYRITIDGVRFECRTYAEALALLAKAKETARKLAEDQAIWAITPESIKPIQAPVITVSSRELRSAAAQTKREIVDIYAKEMQLAETRMLMAIVQRRQDDDETILLLM
jgi:hypothetical protein